MKKSKQSTCTAATIFGEIISIIFIISLPLLFIIINSNVLLSNDTKDLQRIIREIEEFNSPENIKYAKKLILKLNLVKKYEEFDNYLIVLEPIFDVNQLCIEENKTPMGFYDSTSIIATHQRFASFDRYFIDTLKFFKYYKNEFPEANLDTVKIKEKFLENIYYSIINQEFKGLFLSCLDNRLKITKGFIFRLYSMDSTFIFSTYVSSNKKIDYYYDLNFYPDYELFQKENNIPIEIRTFSIISNLSFIESNFFIKDGKVYSVQCVRIKNRRIMDLKEIIEHHLDNCEECLIENYLRWEGIEEFRNFDWKR